MVGLPHHNGGQALLRGWLHRVHETGFVEWEVQVYELQNRSGAIKEFLSAGLVLVFFPNRNKKKFKPKRGSENNRDPLRLVIVTGHR